MRHRFFFLILLAACGLDAAAQAPNEPVQAQYVILISVDGLRPDAVTALGPDLAPTFYRFRTEGAWTDNARTDFNYTLTLPNHTTQLTGRRVTTAAGHNWTSNSTPAASQTIHSKKGSYVASAFGVAHDHGLRTGLYAGKSKFILYDQSYEAATGAPDTTSDDDGRDKIDAYHYDPDVEDLAAAFLSAMRADPYHLGFLHLRAPDTEGHAHGWTITRGSRYSDAVMAVDALLGDVFDLVESDPVLGGNTVLILTADHGGTGTGHSNPSIREHYTIPFYVWGAGVAAGADLYTLNPATRSDPGTERPGYSAVLQPIRNGDAANLALALLGLPDVPGSMINTTDKLAVGGAGTTVSREADETPPGGPGLVFESIYPNPFNAHATLRVVVLQRGAYEVRAYDILGRQVYQTDFVAAAPGRHMVDLRLAPLSSGVYVVHVRHRLSGEAVTGAMMRVK